jgi:cation diffusion facilitator family transporter
MTPCYHRVVGNLRTDPDPESERARRRAAVLSLAVAVLVLTGKLAAWRLTASAAVFSDAMESVVNVAAGAMLLFAIIVAARPVDQDHPYGHGKVELFSAGMEGALIALAAALILNESIREIFRGPELQRLGIGAALLVGLSVINGALGLHLIRVGRRTHSVALVADGRHVLTDVWTSAGVVAGLVAVRLTGFALLDPIVAIAVALHILHTGWRLLREAIGGLMDEADEPLLRQIALALEAVREPGWIEAHKLRTLRTGQLLHADLHFTVPRYWDVGQVHEMDRVVTRAVLSAAGAEGDVVVHYDPCTDDHCSQCAMPQCPLRSAPLVAQAPLGDPAQDETAP